MFRRSRLVLIRLAVTVAVLLAVAAAAQAALRADARGAAITAPTVLALTSPSDGSVLSAGSRPTFAWDATPGGRFHVEFSTSAAPFLTVLTSGHRTTSGDQLTPNTNLWRSIVALGAGGQPVYWRVCALHMTADQITATPIASFTIGR